MADHQAHSSGRLALRGRQEHVFEVLRSNQSAVQGRYLVYTMSSGGSAMKVGRRIAIGAASLFLTAALSGGPAFASDNETSDVASGSGSVGVIYGGTTQSIDPTRFDYVPAAGSPQAGMIQPLNASGTQSIGGFTISVGGVPIGIPRILLTHEINGSGLRVTSEKVYFASTSTSVCNYQVVYQNRSGSKIYSSSYSSTYKGCSSAKLMYNSAAPFTARAGVQCARLFSNGVYLGEQCHSIHQ